MQKKYRTQRIHQAQIIQSLENIYISPLESCNLNCKYCYTQKTKNILSNRQILSFIHRYDRYLKNRSHDFLEALSVACPYSQRKKNYDKVLNLKSIIFCGGEVFTLKNFPQLVNKLNSMDIFISIITNGTIDKLEEIKNPNNCQLLVSFDGPKNIHDINRGTGNFQKSKKFVEHAQKLGFPIEIFFLITKDSYPYKDSFDIFNLKKTYLTDRLGSLTLKQISEIRQNYPCYPPKNFACSTLSLQSNGKLYSCCESARPINLISDPIEKTVNNFLNIISKNPFCSDPDYFCGLKNSKKQSK